MVASPVPNTIGPKCSKRSSKRCRGADLLPNFITAYDKDYVRSRPFGAGATPEINAARTAMQTMKNGDAIFLDGDLRRREQPCAACDPRITLPTLGNFVG